MGAAGRGTGSMESGGDDGATGRAASIDGAQGDSRTWRASEVSMTAAAGRAGPGIAGGGGKTWATGSSGAGGNGDRKASGDNGASTGTDMGASCCGYIPCIVALNSAQLDGSARASLTVAKTSSDISSA